MKLPRITIITPSYNQVDFIEETINSILFQDYPNLEYIIMDGGSDDGSADIIRNYEDRLSYWVSEKDGGQTDAIQKGIDRCTGDLFAWVNSDDVLFPGCLDAIAECYMNSSADIIHSDIAYIDSDSHITRLVKVPCQSRFFADRGVLHMTAPCVFFKTSFCKQVGGLSSHYHLSMDVDIWYKMISAGASIQHVENYLGGFRWHDTSKTVTAINNRKSYENDETVKIIESYLPDTSVMKRAFWRKMYNLYQLVNMNYFKSYWALKSIDASTSWNKAIGNKQ